MILATPARVQCPPHLGRGPGRVFSAMPSWRIGYVVLDIWSLL